MSDKVPIEFTIHMDAGLSQLEKNDDGPDFLDVFLSNAQLAGAVGGRHANRIAEEFQGETAHRDKEFGQIYKTIAKRAASPAQTPLAKTSGDDWEQPVGTLSKRASGVTSGYREWYRRGIALGKSASGMLADWLAANPTHSVDVERELRAVASEF